MNFSKALEAAKDGAKITRKGWNGKGMHAQVQRPDQNSKMNNPYMYLVKSSMGLQSLIPWTPSQGDLFGEDWEVLAEANKADSSQKLFAYKNERGTTVYLEDEFAGNQYLKRNKLKDRVIQ